MELSAEKLTVKQGGKTILQDLSIKFQPGARTAIIGPNGAGKSTLLKALAGLNHKYSGHIWLDEQEITTFSRNKLARELAILPQATTAAVDTTVAQLVDYGRFPYRSIWGRQDSRKDREAVDWAMQVTKVSEFANRKLASLSGGERQRAFLAMVLAQQPQILLLDEPTTYLDIAHQLEVMNIVAKINRDYKMTVIMVLHDINHALQYADRIAVLANKQIIASGEPSKVLTVELLASVFGVRADVFTNSRGAKVLSPLSLVDRKNP